MKNIERKALAFIRKCLLNNGTSPTVRQVAEHLGYKSPRSAAQTIDSLISEGFLKRHEKDKSLQIVSLPGDAAGNTSTTEVPLVGSAPCGRPLLATENLETTIPVSTSLARPQHQYFLLRADGTSMNAAGIEDGSLVLVRQQQTAENGEIVVALVDDEATIKELRVSRDAVALLPKSRESHHKPIILSHDFLIQGVVVATLPDIETI